MTDADFLDMSYYDAVTSAILDSKGNKKVLRKMLDAIEVLGYHLETSQTIQEDKQMTDADFLYMGHYFSALEELFIYADVVSESQARQEALKENAPSILDMFCFYLDKLGVCELDQAYAIVNR